MSAATSRRWPMDVSIIMPVFNKAELTEACLNALPDTTRDVSHEVIVVDNASTDATPRLLAARQSVRHLRNDRNRGFAGACNQGAAAARGHHLLFLNNDMVPLDGWLGHLVLEFRQRSEVAVVGSRLLYPNGLVQHAGVAFARETRSPFYPHRNLLGDDPRANVRRELQAVTAACVLIRRSWFERCGGFNEEYHNGYEDLDLCLNIRRHGGVIVYQPKSVLVHFESQTPERVKFDDANRALFLKKWANSLLADEDAYYLAEGHKVIYQLQDGRLRSRLARLSGEADRRAWQVVAELQRHAAEDRWGRAAALLDDEQAWPADAAVRRWAAAVAYRMNRPAAGATHLRRALELEPSSDALLQWIRCGHDRTAGEALCAQDAGVRLLVEGFRAFGEGRFDDAGAAFEEALVMGGNPREALFGMAATAARIGDAATVQQCGAAMLASRPADPLAATLLQQAGAHRRGARPVPAA